MREGRQKVRRNKRQEREKLGSNGRLTGVGKSLIDGQESKKRAVQGIPIRR